tara:strand:+ start:720 stop:1370 length:651 start_codon:yes stop_codon:yes gene_type:complete
MDNVTIINKYDINPTLNEFSKYDECIIFGKGPTLTYFNKDNYKNTLFICINNSINYIKKCDLLVCNDYESFTHIDIQYYKSLKYILVPYHPHYKENPHENITYKNIINYIKSKCHHFTGKLIIYNLSTSGKIYHNFISLNSRKTSVHTAFEFIIKFVKNIRLINFYGFAKNTQNREINVYKNKKDEDFHKNKNKKNEYINHINFLNSDRQINYVIN